MKCCWSRIRSPARTRSISRASFDERVGLTGIVLTRVDGDGRGGAALSMRAVTGKPIKLIGTGEKTDALEDFHPSRIAGRILGMGDVVSLVEKAAANIDAEKAARTAERMRKGQFDLSDMREQLLQMANMGGISGLMGMMPGIAKMKNQIAECRARRQDPQAPGRDDRFDDAAGAQESRHPQSQPQEAHRRRRRPQGRGSQQAPEDAPEHGRHDEGHGLGQARPDGRHRAGDGFWRRHGGGMPSPEEMAKLAEKMPGGAGPGGMPAACRRIFREFAGSARRSAERTAGLGPNLPGGLPPVSRAWKEEMAHAPQRFSAQVALDPNRSGRCERSRRTNPVHHDSEVAAKSRFGRLIASGPHTTAHLLALTASHFSKHGAMLGLEFRVLVRRPFTPTRPSRRMARRIGQT